MIVYLTISLKRTEDVYTLAKLKAVIHAVQFWYELLLAECSSEGFSACRTASLKLTWKLSVSLLCSHKSNCSDAKT